MKSSLIFSALMIMAGPVNSAAPAAANPEPPCTESSAACLETIAKIYLNALVTHDGSKLPLAATVRRSENALTNAIGANEVRESFVRTHMVEGVRDARYYVDAAKGDVVVFFRADIDLKPADISKSGATRAGDTDYKVSVSVPAGTYTVHEAERFKIVKGFITEIEIIAHVEKGKGAGSGWPVARDAKAAKATEPAAKK